MSGVLVTLTFDPCPGEIWWSCHEEYTYLVWSVDIWGCGVLNFWPKPGWVMMFLSWWIYLWSLISRYLGLWCPWPLSKAWVSYNDLVMRNLHMIFDQSLSESWCPWPSTHAWVSDDGIVMRNIHMKSDDSISKHFGFLTKV